MFVKFQFLNINRLIIISNTFDHVALIIVASSGVAMQHNITNPFSNISLNASPFGRDVGLVSTRITIV